MRCHEADGRILGTWYVLEIMSESPDLRLECKATNIHSSSLIKHVKLYPKGNPFASLLSFSLFVNFNREKALQPFKGFNDCYRTTGAS
jgi:hypothetical protein